jgi:thiol-disulfide isomerase/thioredoxin
LLIKDVIQAYKGRVRYVSEDWGESRLAERFEIKRYPVVFVNDALLAKPEDFGGWGRNEGKYAPWRSTASHEKFKKDLTRLIDLALRGESPAPSELNSLPDANNEITSLPGFSMKDLKGQMIESARLAGKVVVVEFWATWCAPCRSTLGWLGEVKRRYGDKVEVVTIALESDEGMVRKMTEALPQSARVAIGTDETVAPFGVITSVPTMFVFDRRGKVASVFYGAPPTLHQKAGRLLDSLVK